MRKITSILSMFLLIAGWNTASAQFAFKKFASFGDDITDVSQLVDGGYYVLQNFQGNKCIKIKTDGSMVLGLDDKITDDDASDGLAVFKLHIDKSGTTPLYSFESASTGYYIPTIEMDHHKKHGGVVVSTTPGKFELRTQDCESNTPEAKKGYFTIKNSTDDNYFDIASEAGLLTGWKGKDDRAWFKIRKANLNEDASALQVFYKMNIKKDGVALSAAYGMATTGEECTEPSVPYYFKLVTPPEDKMVTKEKMTFDYVYEYGDNVPFVPGQWYSLRIKDGNRVLRAVAEENTFYTNTEKGTDLNAIANTYPNFLNALWRIEESGLGVKIYNKAVGKYLKANGGATAGQRATFDANGTVFTIGKKDGKDGSSSVVFKYGSNAYLNASCTAGNTPNARLGLWNADGNGSTFFIEKTKEELLALGQTAFAKIDMPNVSYTDDNALIKGGIEPGRKDLAAAATTLDGLLKIGDYASNSNAGYPETAAYYLIRNVNQGAVGTHDEMNKYLSSEFVLCDKDGKIQTQVGETTNDRNIKRTNKSSSLLPRLWQFEEATDGKYYLRNVNTDKYVALSEYLDIPTDQYQVYKTAFSLEATNEVFSSNYNVGNDQTTMFLMGANNTFVNAQNGMGFNGVATWNHRDDGGNYWQFIKVIEVPLTIAANDYTTLCLPFNVKLPEGSAVKAYYASQAAGDVLKLKEITGIIPANEGVILQNTGDAETTINLTITTDEATTLNGNKLKGVTAKREGYDALSNYVLATKNGATGFYKAKFTAITANKAYLPVANVQNAQGVMMAFSFGDEVTGIDNVNAAAPAAKKYYDLQGRRVLYPAKGIFVTEDGQKVLFK